MAADSPYKRILKRIAHLQVQHPYLTVLIVLAITLLLAGGTGQVRTVAALENMMPAEMEEIAAFAALRDAGRGQEMIAIVIERNPESTIAKPDILDWQTYEYIKLVSDTLAAEQDVLAVYSLSSALEMQTGEELEEQAFTEMAKKSPLIDEYVNDARTNTLIIATTDVSANDARMTQLAQRIHADMESLGHPPGLRYALTGTPIIQQELGELIAKDRRNTQLLSTALVFIIVAILFGTLTSALVPIIVVSLAVTWLYGTMGYVGLPISTLAGGVAAMVIGIGIDYAIHLMNRFKYERKRGCSVGSAIEQAVADTGLATTGASITTLLAFLAFLTGAMPEMHRFGLLMAIGVGYSFLLTILALPALLILEERAFYWLRGHLHFGPEGQYYLATKDEIAPPGYQRLERHEVPCDEIGQRFVVHRRGGRR